MKNKIQNSKKLKPRLLNVVRFMGRWQPSDDFLLIQSVLQLNDLTEVKQLTKFSRNFTLKEIKDRWYALMYNQPISKMIRDNIKKLHYDDVLRLKKLAPFSTVENSLLLNIDSRVKEEKIFDDFLYENRVLFYESRTAEQLREQWEILKELKLLKNQTAELVESDNSLQVSFDEFEDRLDDERIISHVFPDEEHDRNMRESYESILHTIKRCEADLFLWQALADKVTGRTNPFLEIDTLAVLFSNGYEFKMKSRQITMGRQDKNSCEVDLNLAEIKQNKKISRRQCSLILVAQNFFILINHGKVAVFVDGKAVPTHSKTKVFDKSIIQIEDISLLFLFNYNTIAPGSDDYKPILPNNLKKLDEN